jgi:hypothetical protein
MCIWSLCLYKAGHYGYLQTDTCNPTAGSDVCTFTLFGSVHNCGFERPPDAFLIQLDE